LSAAPDGRTPAGWPGPVGGHDPAVPFLDRGAACSDRFGVYASYVSKCKAGERRAGLVELAQFCRAYGINLVDFLRDARLT
jgi:hypothetical protein